MIRASGRAPSRMVSFVPARLVVPGRTFPVSLQMDISYPAGDLIFLKAAASQTVQAARKGIPDSGAQLDQVVTELQQLNTTNQEIASLLKGELKVRLVNPTPLNQPASSTSPTSLTPSSAPAAARSVRAVQ